MHVTVAVAGSFAAMAGALANDWGYEGEVQPQRAIALPLSAASPAPGAQRKSATPPAATAKVGKPAPGRPPVKPSAGSTVASKVPAGAPPSEPPARVSAPKVVRAAGAGAGRQELALECWSQIYQLAAGHKLDDGQTKQLRAILQNNPARVQSVIAFWPKVTEYLDKKPEQTENYARLLKALLRYNARVLSGSAEPPAGASSGKAESNLIATVLGPERLAVQGNPAFSEEAVEAYADMACFLYEQRNPGKTIDAFDNRAMFASVVCEKFRNAPSDKDRQAMAAFDLAWAKFKVAWEAAGEKTRADMMAQLQKTGANAGASSAQDPILKSVLDNWRL